MYKIGQSIYKKQQKRERANKESIYIFSSEIERENMI